MKLLVEAVEVDEEVDVDMGAVVVLTVTFQMMRIHSLPLEHLLPRDLLKKEILISPQKGVVMVDLVDLTVVVVEVVSAMEKWVRRDAHEEHLNAGVGLDEGE